MLNTIKVNNNSFGDTLGLVKGCLLLLLLFCSFTMGPILSSVELRWMLVLGSSAIFVFCGYFFRKIKVGFLDSLLLVITVTMLIVRMGFSSFMLYTGVVALVTLTQGYHIGIVIALLCGGVSYVYLGAESWTIMPFLLGVSYLISKKGTSFTDSRDLLTGVYNHSYFKEVLDTFIKNGELFSLVLFDIDDFKYYNEINGYPQGDQMLKKIARQLEKQLVFRYSGDQFMVILPGVDKDLSIEWANQVRREMTEVTLCAGVVTYPDDGVQLIAKAEDARDHAKFYEKDRAHRYASILSDLTDLVGECDDELKGMLKILVSLVNAWDPYTYGHILRVANFSRLIGREFGISSKDEQELIFGAYLHDIGKLDIDRFILNKRIPLEEEEWLTLKEHPQRGVQLIKACQELKPYEMFILHHHERFDGRGYPSHLKGEEIPFLVRILTVADSFDAMTSRRSYNQPKSYVEGIEELKRFSGDQFDPEIVEAFSRVIKRKEYFS